MDLTQMTEVIDLSAGRTEFIRKTYSHLFVAILGFIGLEFFFFQSGYAYPMARAMLSVSWLFVIGGFMVVGWMASHFARTVENKSVQYLALAGFVVAESIFFVPLLVMAQMKIGFNVISDAALVSLLAFTILTAIVFQTKKDFSFMRTFLMWGGVCALLLIVMAVIFGFNLGLLFSVAMVCLAGASILYDTSNVLHHYSNEHYVGAALDLFSSLAMLFWYILRIFMHRD